MWDVYIQVCEKMHMGEYADAFHKNALAVWLVTAVGEKYQHIP